MSDIGLIFGEGAHNRFVLSENDQLEEVDEVECIIRIPKERKVLPLIVDKNDTAGKLYKRVLQLCQANEINTEYFVLTFNSYKIDTTDVVKVC